jgi:hypothetical protein
MLLPQIAAQQKRREVAIDHLKKSLEHARQFMRAMDLPAKPPASVRFYLVAGDSENTDKTVQFDHNGRLKAVETAPGDAVVLRSSQLESGHLFVFRSSQYYKRSGVYRQSSLHPAGKPLKYEKCI